jgi:DNA-binding transcriptional LysR family regulator
MNLLMQDLTDLRKGVARHIRLTSSTAAINQFLPPLLASYAQLNPDVQVDLDEEVSERVVASLRDGSTDIGAYVEGPNDDNLVVKNFRQDQLVLILPAGHALAGRKPIAFVDTLGEPWISLASGAALLMKQQQTAFAAGRPFKLRMQVRSFDAVGHMVASGLGIAVLPKAAAMPVLKALKLTWRPLSDEWSRRQLKIAVRMDADAAVRALQDYLCQPSQNAKASLAKFK